MTDTALLDLETRGDITIVTLRGDVDLDVSPQVRRALKGCLDGTPERAVVVYMGEVGYVDSSFIASLIDAYQTAKRLGKGFALAGVGTSAMRVLRLGRLDRVFPIHDTVDDAIGALG